MKKIEAIIRHFKLDEIKTSLSEAGVEGMTITRLTSPKRKLSKLNMCVIWVLHPFKSSGHSQRN